MENSDLNTAESGTTTITMDRGIKVCDAIMGTGKTEAAIKYMNDHIDQKFIYVSPYIDQIKRIQSGCPLLGFVEPDDKLRRYGGRKVLHSKALIEAGKNIASTHAALGWYTDEMLQMVHDKGYTLIVDEAINTLSRIERPVPKCDMDILINGGVLKISDDGECTFTRESGFLREVQEYARNRVVYHSMYDDDKSSFFVWTLPPKLITSFKNVFVLTYLFEAQGMGKMFKMHNIPYININVAKLGVTEEGKPICQFTNGPGYTPDYVPHLRELIEIFQNPDGKNSCRLNDIGDEKCALSKSWYNGAKLKRAEKKKSKDAGRYGLRKKVVEVEKLEHSQYEQLQKNLFNYFRNVAKMTPDGRVATVKDRLWGTFTNSDCNVRARADRATLFDICGAANKNSGLIFNSRATNEYADRTIVAYCVNIFMNVDEKLFYTKRGIEIDEDIYALSIMIQWIWRSAIRKGQPIKIYIPSSRMRRLLEEWIEEVSKGANLVA